MKMANAHANAPCNTHASTSTSARQPHILISHEITRSYRS